MLILKVCPEPRPHPLFVIGSHMQWPYKEEPVRYKRASVMLPSIFGQISELPLTAYCSLLTGFDAAVYAARKKEWQMDNSC